MAIADTISSIKTYFLNWHRENYNTLHPEIANEVTNRSPTKDEAVTSGAVYNYVNNQIDTNILTNKVWMANNRQKTLQSTLDDFNTSLNTKLNKTQYTSATVESWDSMSGENGTHIWARDVQDGVMKWEEKLLLQELATWHTISKGLPPKSSMEVNFALGLCHLHIYAKNTTKFKNDTKWTHEADGGDALQQFTPPAHVSNACGSPFGAVITITPYGGFSIHTTKKYNKTNLVGDIIWKFSNGKTLTDDSNYWGTKKKTIYPGIQRWG